MTATGKRRKAKSTELSAPPSGALIGYARVSTKDQSLEMQIDALKKAGCTHIYREKVSASKRQFRAELALAIKDLREGDTLVVWRLDRLSRSMQDLYDRLQQIKDQGASFRSLTENFEFTTAIGQLILGMIALMAQFEAQLTAERTKAGIKVLQERGKKFGAIVKLTAAKQREAKRLLAMKERRSVRGVMVWRRRYTKKQVAKALSVSTQTLYLFLKNNE